MALDKDTAAAFLGCSPRQLERYVKDNRISVTYEREAGRTRQKPMYDEIELQRLKDEIEAPLIKPVVSQHNPQNGMAPDTDVALSLLSPLNEGGQGTAFLAIIADVAGKAAARAIEEQKTQQQNADVQGLASKLFLTVAEASQFAGIGKTTLESAIKNGDIKVHNGLGRGRRIRRADLEKWAESL